MSFTLLVEQRVGSHTTLLLRDILPEGLNYIPGSTRLNGRVVPDVAGESQLTNGLDVGSDGGELPVGASAEVSIQARIDESAEPGSRFVNRARAQSQFGAPVEDAATVVVEGQPELSAFVKEVEVVDDPEADIVPVGGRLRWTLTVQNTGTGPARDLRLVDPIRGEHVYVPDSLRLDGRQLSDATDDDAGQIDGRNVEVRIQGLDAGDRTSVTFETLVNGGQLVINQALVSESGGDRELSDDGGTDTDEPTSIEVGEPPRPAVELTKRLVGRDVAEAAPGEVVRFELEATNIGNVDLEQLVITDVFPEGMDFVRLNDESGSLTPEITDDRLIVSSRLPQDETLKFTIDMVLDPRRLEPVELCNRATASSEGLAPADAEACLTVVLRTGSVTGLLFEDSDGTPGQSEGDLVFEGMTVQAFRSLADERDPIAEAVTGDSGSFELPVLPTGTYRFTVVTSAGVVIAGVDGVEVTDQTPAQVNIPIDPSGRVYDSVTGALIDGAIIRIYRDNDADNDPFDEESLRTRELVEPEDLEHPTQQGQRTAHGGMYQFAVRRAGRYIIEVEAPGVAYLSPSARIVPQPGYESNLGADRNVVPNALPSVEPDAQQTYFVAFQLAEQEDVTFTITFLDPLSSLTT